MAIEFMVGNDNLELIVGEWYLCDVLMEEGPMVEQCTNVRQVLKYRGMADHDSVQVPILDTLEAVEDPTSECAALNQALFLSDDLQGVLTVLNHMVTVPIVKPSKGKVH